MLTAHDVQTYLANVFDETLTAVFLGHVRSAISEALRQLALDHAWSYYDTSYRLVTSAPQTSSTITFDYTGGAYERLVTLASGTWPSWAAHGIIVISSVAYEVAERIDDTRLTLESWSTPSSDVAAGTTYTLYRNHYALPSDFKAGGELSLTANNRDIGWVAPREWQYVKSRNPTLTSQPRYFTFLGEHDSLGAMQLALYPAPDSAYNLEFLYHRMPRAITTWDYRTGTVTTTADNATVTGSGTSFTTRMEGSVFRPSANATDYPTDLAGAKPYEFEKRIAQRVSATSLRLVDTTGVTALSGVRYIISDPIDIDENTMLNAFLRCAEWKLAVKRGGKDVNQRFGLYQQELVRARGADSRYQGPRVMGGMRPRSRGPFLDAPTGSDVS